MAGSDSVVLKGAAGPHRAVGNSRGAGALAVRGRRLAWTAAGMLFTVACATPEVWTPQPPVAPAASSAMLEAWTRSRGSGFKMGSADFEEAVEQARLAASLAPDWAAPGRFLDRWSHRPGLTLPDRFAAHLAAAEDGDSRASYLAGRLGGAQAGARFERATELEPDLSWAWHGQAWTASRALRLEAAVRDERRALALARDPSEVALFAWSLGTFLDAGEQTSEAIGVLRGALAGSGQLALREPERAMVGALLARLLLRASEPIQLARGVEQAKGWIASPWVTARERLELVEGLLGVGQGLVSGAEIELALAQGAANLSGEGRRAAVDLLASLRRGSRPTATTPGWRVRLVEGFGRPGTGAQEAGLQKAGVQPAGVQPVGDQSAGRRTAGAWGPSPQESRSGDAPRGGKESAVRRTEAVLEAWCADLPAAVKDSGGLPLNPALAALMESVRSLDEEAPTRDQLREVGRQLLAVGWFSEAVAWAARIAAGDPEGAQDLEVAALRGRAALGALLNLGRRLDAMQAYVSAGADPEKITSAKELHDEVARVLERGGWTEVPEGGLRSPVISYGPAGSIVHPGPSFSEEDGRLGRGAPGAPVPGLAAAFEAMGRFALVGRGAGQGGPDATVLRKLHAQPRSGEHLGRGFSGVAIWCQGADVPGRITRRGGAISGAALHEGFYIDLEVIATERDYWGALLEVFSGPDGAPNGSALAAALAVPSPSPAPATSLEPALGAADRMRLAVMCDLGGVAPRVPTLDVFCDGVIVHEEAHLCDRMAWYPLTATRVLRLISFAAGQGFSGGRISQALEERAQLVALAVLEDPRLMWIDLLDAAGRNLGGGGAPHGAAYRRLLGRLVKRMHAESLEGGWSELPGVGARWVDRLHLVAPEDLRALARREAKAAGLTR